MERDIGYAGAARPNAKGARSSTFLTPLCDMRMPHSPARMPHVTGLEPTMPSAPLAHLVISPSYPAITPDAA